MSDQPNTPKELSDVIKIRRSDFIEYVYNVVRSDETGHTTYFDAVMKACEHFSVDPSAVKRYLSAPLMSQLHKEAQELRLLKKEYLHTHTAKISSMC